MRKLLLGALLLLSTLSFSQTPFYSESFGSGTGDIITYYGGISPETFQNTFPIVYDGSGKIKNSAGGLGSEGNSFLPSNITNSSGISFLWLYSNWNLFNIQGINTSLYSGCKISFNIRLGVTNISRRNLKLEQSIDGINFTEIILPTLPPNQWVNLELNDNIFTSNNLRLRFSGVDINGTQGSISIDDIKMTYTSLSTNQNTLTELNLYPNPTNDILHLSTNTDKNIKIYDMIGNKVIDKDVTNFLDISNLSNGIYLCEIKEGDKKITKKIVKNI